MRRLLTTSATLLLLIGLVGGGVATAGERDHKRDKPRAKELTLHSRETSSMFVTASGEVFEGPGEPEVAPGPGDRFLVVDTLFRDPERTEEVGRNLIECTFITALGETEEEFTADVLCHGVVTLDDQGDLAWQAQFRAPEAFLEDPFVTVAITGGTGAFERAGGSAQIFDESPEDQSESLARYEVRLLLFRTAKVR